MDNKTAAGFTPDCSLPLDINMVQATASSAAESSEGRHGIHAVSSASISGISIPDNEEESALETSLSARNISSVTPDAGGEHWVSGGIYAHSSDDGVFKCFKVLVVDDIGIHIKMYPNKFQHLPSVAECGQLGNPVSPELGINAPVLGHVPVERNAINEWGASLVTSENVTEDEMVGYEIWAEESGGGYLTTSPMDQCTIS